jgi:hypothetical protein
MTLSERILSLGLAFLLLSGPVLAATPPDAEMAAAAAAIASAERAQPRGPAAELLDQARASYASASQAMSRKKYRDALGLAEEAHASADLACAQARLANARAEVDEKAARNADLRRQLLVLPESRP